MRGSLLLLAPMAPCRTGNGLAMRVAGFAEGAAADWDPTVVVLPVAGHLPHPCPSPIKNPVIVVDQPERRDLARSAAALLADPGWRHRLGAAGDLPSHAASPALADAVVRAAGVENGTPVLAVRAYLAPLALAVAERVGAPWCALDFDDDDEALARAQGDLTEAEAYRRLVATFGPRLAAVSLASPIEAAAVAQRHQLRTETVPNAVAVPSRPPRRSPEPGTVLFVANLTYPPNVDAAIALVEDVLPALRRRGRPVPHVVLAGPFNQDSPIDQWRDRPDVTVTGFVDHLDGLYARAAVAVAPIRHSSGTRIKVLEAFAHGVPVVTTEAGAAGLAVQSGEHLLVAETVGDLVTSTHMVLSEPDTAARLADAAFSFVRRHHDMSVMAGRVRVFLAAASTRSVI